MALTASAVTSCTLATVTIAQDPIRVEAHLVLVPASVYKSHMDLERMEFDSRVPSADDLTVNDLTAGDFHLFEDDVEQRIQNVTLEWTPGGDVRDSVGIHVEVDGPGGGKWSSRDRLDTTHVIVVNTPHYLIAYSPPESPEGSCHQIRVTVVRPNVFVRARSEYCNTEHSAADPLKGTKLGQQMESDLASARVGKFNLTVVGVVSYTNTDAARVHIVLEFPAEPLKNAANNKAEHAVGVLGMVYKKDGDLAARFSDRKSFEPPGTPYKNEMLVALPTRYETQLELPRGEYDLRTVLSDGTDFGVAQVPLSVNSYDEKQLALSEIAICGRLRQVSRELKKDTAKPRGTYVPLVSNGLEITPTANSRFKRGATLGVYFEVYEPQLAGPPPTTVEAHLRIVDLRTGVMKAVQPINTAPYVKVGSPIIPIGRQIEIKNLPKGSYRLEVQAADSRGKTTAWRAVNFTVE
jgi:hypothetical protein